MSFLHSQPLESLLEHHSPGSPLARARVVVIGSGYGGAVAAYRLAGAKPDSADIDYDVLVLERGNEYLPGEFPTGLEDLPGHVQIRRSGHPSVTGSEEGLFDFRIGRGVDVLVGSGLGGTSLINANVAIRPENAVFQSEHWPRVIRQEMSTDQNSPLQKAFAHVSEWLGVESSRPESLKTLNKFKALSHLAHALGTRADAAPLAVTLDKAQTSKAGILQPPCTACGNCVTGCNVGAKNTLVMNLIPAAVQRGARFITGATVAGIQSVNREDSGSSRWFVHVRPTSRASRARVREALLIEADIVVLAAGTIGTTEILARSSASYGLACSPRLGKRFSANGDGLAMAYAGREPVNAIGDLDYRQPKPGPGPTISGVVRARTLAGDAFTLEEGTIPAALAELFGEVITTSAQVARLGDNRLPGWFRQRGRQPDPISVNVDALQHSQVFLVMSDDEAAGSLQVEGSEHAIFPHWPNNGGTPNQTLSRIGTFLAEHDRAPGLRHGQYVHNPLWMVGNEAMANLLEGGLPGGRLVTVHPLGGCAMGESADTGVVNHLGQVFTGTGDSVHAGLYVMDGSIVPAALGINPFLTIAALAWRACDHLVSALEVTEKKEDEEAPAPRDLVLVPGSNSDAQPKRAGQIVVHEQLLGDLSRANAKDKAAFLKHFPDTERLFQKEGIVLQLKTDPADTQRLLAGEPVRLSAKLFLSPIKEEIVLQERTYGFVHEHALDQPPFAAGAGTVTLMAADSPNLVQSGLRAIEAIRTYLARRESLAQVIRRGKGQSPGAIVDAIRALWNVAVMHGTYRIFEYDIELLPTDHRIESAIHLRGRKRVAWRRDQPRMWQALLELPARVSVPDIGFKADTPLKVDLEHLLGKGLVSAHSSHEVVTGLLNVIGFTARLARGLLQAGFWELGGPSYPKNELSLNRALPETLPNGARLETKSLRVPEFTGRNQPEIQLELHCYRGEGSREPILLVHGLAQGSLIFAHPSLRMSMAQSLYDSGFDVWMLDHRLSNRLGLKTDPRDGWSIDEIGAIDIPKAIEQVRAAYADDPKVHVFAHCVGAIAVEMAILGGQLSQNQLASVALNAIHPWSVPSPANRVRSRIAVFVRDWLSNDFLDPIVESRDRIRPEKALIDRLAFSLARLGEEPADIHSMANDLDLADAICDRMTLLYGRMWRHRNVQDIHPFWKDLVGPAPTAVVLQLYYMLIRKRVLDREGDNRYLTLDRVGHWEGIRTLFVHGAESHVYNPQSAVRSAKRLKKAFELLRSKSPAFNTPRIGLQRIPGFGHMDVILAERAHQEHFRHLRHFFRGDFDDQDEVEFHGERLALEDFESLHDSHSNATPRLVTGPILRGAYFDGNLLQLRYWVEVPTLGTSPVERVEFVTPNSARISGPFRPSGVGDSFQWFDLQLDPRNYAEVSAEARYDARGSVAYLTIDAPAKPDPGTRGNTPTQPGWLTRLCDRTRRDDNDCHFIVGSCRHPGSPFDAPLSDEIFKGINLFLDHNGLCDAVFLLGDQIYADASAGLFDPIPWRDRYEQRYREAFGSSEARRMLRRAPIHFALDDHEFSDDFMGPIEDASIRTAGIPIELRMKHGEMKEAEFQFAKRTASSFTNSARLE